jgi:hypothetical protein
VPRRFGSIGIIVSLREVALVLSWCSRMWERNVVSGALLELEASADCYPLLLCWAELGRVCLLVYSFFLLVLVLCGILGLVSRPSLCNILVGGSGLVFDLSLVVPFFFFLMKWHVALLRHSRKKYLFIRLDASCSLVAWNIIVVVGWWSVYAIWSYIFMYHSYASICISYGDKGRSPPLCCD